MRHVSSAIVKAETLRVTNDGRESLTDTLSVEEPLEIRVEAQVCGERSLRPVAITMRTPGEDLDLARGFLFTEGIIDSFEAIAEIVQFDANVVAVKLRDDVTVPDTTFDRHSFVASSCGVCGKRSIEAVQVRRNYKLEKDHPLVAPATIHALPQALRAAQKAFDSTGGIHASGLFDSSGKLLMLREDVGRHNALDKIIGAAGAQSLLPLKDKIILVSGRASFELIQKAAHAGTPIVAAVGAPSSLAVQLAEESDMTLLGFVRDGRFNIYAGPGRVTA